MHEADISAAPSARHLPGPGPAGARPHSCTQLRTMKLSGRGTWVNHARPLLTVSVRELHCRQLVVEQISRPKPPSMVSM